MAKFSFDKPIAIHPSRIQKLNSAPYANGPVLYWMSRDQRVADNWALLYAQQIAQEHGQPLAVLFCISPTYLGASARSYAFMLEGLEQTSAELQRLGIPFFLLAGEPPEAIAPFITAINAGALITDFDPLRIKRIWKERLAQNITIPFREVDAHNIVPCWIASHKREYSAATLRKKITPRLPEFLTAIPPVQPQHIPWPTPPKNANLHPLPWQEARAWAIRLPASGPPLTWIRPGEAMARQLLRNFIDRNLATYDETRNDPVRDGQSNLSPHLHFGHISAQRAALEATHQQGPGPAAFLEELIIRRELAENYCYYTPNYDTLDGAWDWAKHTLDAHRADPRQPLYTRETFENAQTHDPLWNAAQHEMITRGKMHGYLRMYWAKKILEWSPTPEDAIATAIYLNDTYELDGRDPNGYTGILWSIAGVHDRPWAQRPIFGAIRYMNSRGCANKFNTAAYIKRHTP